MLLVEKTKQAAGWLGTNWLHIAVTIILLLVGIPTMGSTFSGCGGAEPIPLIPAEVHAKPGALVKIAATAPATFYAPGLALHADTDAAILAAPQQPGRYPVYAVTVSRAWLPWGTPTLGGPYQTCLVVDGPPIPPVPPVPPVPPIPPAPTDKPAVLMLYDSATETKLPKAQQAVLYDQTLRDYLNAKWPVGPDGKTHEWRIWPSDVDASNEASTALKAALATKRDSLPWIVITSPSGKSGFAGPLPANVADTMTLLQKYGGQ